MHDKLQIIFSNDPMIKNLPLYSCYGQETFEIQSELNLSSSTSFCFTIHYMYRTWQAAMHNYFLVKKNIGWKVERNTG